MSRSNIIASVAVVISLVSAAAAWKSEATAQRAVELQQRAVELQRGGAIAQTTMTLSSMNTATAEGTLKRLCGITPRGDIDLVSYVIFQKSCSEKFPEK